MIFVLSLIFEGPGSDGSAGLSYDLMEKALEYSIKFRLEEIQYLTWKKVGGKGTKFRRIFEGYWGDMCLRGCLRNVKNVLNCPELFSSQKTWEGVCSLVICLAFFCYWAKAQASLSTQRKTFCQQENLLPPPEATASDA